MRSRHPALALVLGVTALSSACGGGGGPREEQRVRGTLERFVQAGARRDAPAICDRLFAPKLVEQIESVGLPCDVALARSSLFTAQRPRLVVQSVTVRGGRAFARVRTSAANGTPSTDTVELVKVAGQWRILSLVGPPAPPGQGAAPKQRGSGD